VNGSIARLLNGYMKRSISWEVRALSPTRNQLYRYRGQ